MKIIIIGAGIGGLTAAAALAANGHEVQVLEQTPEPKPVGAGISLQPNAMQALARIGLDDCVSQQGFASSIATIWLSSGQQVQTMDFSSYVDRYGFLPYTIHRADLFDLLFRAATDQGAQVRFGVEFDSFTAKPDSVTARSSDEQFRCDALIGADGIHSKVRSEMFTAEPTRYSGYVCWRGIVSDPDLVSSVDTMNELWGKGARFGYMRCSQDKIYWFATKTIANRGRPDSSWKHEFSGWPDPVAALLEATPESQIAFNDISDRKPRFPWSRGPVTLLGDAAHPMTPNFGQGGAQAIEDAIVLAQAVERHNQPDLAFDHYQRHRHPRTKSFVDRSLQFGRVAQGGKPWWRAIRNTVLPRIPESSLNKMLDEQFMVGEHLNLERRDSDP